MVLGCPRQEGRAHLCRLQSVCCRPWRGFLCSTGSVPYEAGGGVRGGPDVVGVPAKGLRRIALETRGRGWKSGHDGSFAVVLFSVKAFILKSFSVPQTAGLLSLGLPSAKTVHLEVLEGPLWGG